MTMPPLPPAGSTLESVISAVDTIRIVLTDVINNQLFGRVGETELELMRTGLRQPVRLASTVNGTLATAFNAGDSLDGVALVRDDRILLKNQTAGAENGIYTVNDSTAPTRAFDADSDDEVVSGIQVFVEEGAQSGSLYALTTANPIILDTTALTFTKISA